MEFRPCIDIHNGQVRQIVGSSLRDRGDAAQINFATDRGAEYYAQLYAEHGLRGGHIILLNPAQSDYYEATKAQALRALAAYPQGMQIGGGISAENAEFFLRAGASHVIVTSYVFREGRIDMERLERLRGCVGREHLVLDLSCRRQNDRRYYIVTDRWQKVTDVAVNENTLDMLMDYCDEFLIHAVDVEGKSAGIEQELAAMLGAWGRQPITYAGGVHDYEDIDILRKIGQNRVNVTVGSALDIFGGPLKFTEIIKRTAG